MSLFRGQPKTRFSGDFPDYDQEDAFDSIKPVKAKVQLVRVQKTRPFSELIPMHLATRWAHETRQRSYACLMCGEQLDLGSIRPDVADDIDRRAELLNDPKTPFAACSSFKKAVAP